MIGNEITMGNKGAINDIDKNLEEKKYKITTEEALCKLTEQRAGSYYTIGAVESFIMDFVSRFGIFAEASSLPIVKKCVGQELEQLVAQGKAKKIEVIDSGTSGESLTFIYRYYSNELERENEK